MIDSGPDGVEITVLMPCLNEAETLAACIHKAHLGCQKIGLRYEILVADNGSSDGSPEIAATAGARVVHVPVRGYGAALRTGIEAARGKFIIMGDSDESYDFSELRPFIEKWQVGYDLVMGTRLRGEIKPGAMPFLHRWLGNPLLTGMGNLLFHCGLSDYHCGLRGFDRQAMLTLDLRTDGMEFASEMVIKAALAKLKMTETPITLWPDGRSRPPHLRTWRDGWRHLRFMLLYSPRWLFLYPGIVLMVLGLGVGLWLLPGPRMIGNVTFDVHTLLFAGLAVLMGFQSITLAVFTKIFAVIEGLLPDDPQLTKMFRYLTLEVGLIVGAVLILIGAGGSVYGFLTWSMFSFGPLPDLTYTLRFVILAVVSLTLGGQVILSSFFLSVLGLSRRGLNIQA
ncbi:MAG: glycosyltransferase family 2 protein [Anaerolineae bacterium]|nr:glycosyltransferase family 2 protein [Anaerolineales bacterium]MCQ3978210.1 glycosyltransferase family 2 protein [Anaerolineae bacterium]